LVLIACLCNPIIINTFVVFVRLYWFEKRFQGVARQARDFRRARTRSRTKSEEKHDPNYNREERGVGNREIMVLHDGNGHAAEDEKGGVIPQDIKEKSGSDGSSDSPNGTAAVTDGTNGSNALHDDEAVSPKTIMAPFPTFHRDITFADEVPRPVRDIPNEERTPEQRAKEQHIAFVENQRNQKDEDTLWIPGPRDVERGFAPQPVEGGGSGEDLGREISNDGGRPGQIDLNTPIAMDSGADQSPMRQRFRASLAKLKPKSKSRDDENTKNIRSMVGSRTRTFTSFLSQERQNSDPLPYLSYAATIGRNSTFVDLTEEQREELGGIEYRSLKTLAWVLMAYYFGSFLFGIVLLLPWIVRDQRYSQLVKEDGATPTWWGFFTPMSMFTDLGFTLTPDSMVSFQTAVLPLLLGSFLIIIGNTGFPCMLRFVIWTCSKCVPYGSGVWEEFRFLLDHPRRCFTLLFPRKATWWLFGVLVLLNGVDLIFFVILDLDDPVVTSLPRGFQFLDGLFQAASTRTAGFACVNLAGLHPGIQVSYLIMMYISVFPIAISVRQTNVYEEKSLGIYGGSSDDDTSLDPNSTSYLGSHLRRQLSFDLWYVFLGLFLICCIEGRRLQDTKDYAFNIFTVLFEIISAYGTVGLSLGYPGINASFSAELRTLSKLIIIAMMLRGRHRGLPYALDRAILLPSESLQRKEAEMDERRRERRASVASFKEQPPVATTGAMFTGQHTGPPTNTRMTTVGMGITRRESHNTQDDGDHKRGRSVSRSGLKRIVTGALSAGPTTKVHRA
jgi:Trk-type K+ transport system membrane component